MKNLTATFLLASALLFIGACGQEGQEDSIELTDEAGTDEGAFMAVEDAGGGIQSCRDATASGRQMPPNETCTCYDGHTIGCDDTVDKHPKDGKCRKAEVWLMCRAHHGGL
jgi:hypothetical protein